MGGLPRQLMMLHADDQTTASQARSDQFVVSAVSEDGPSHPFIGQDEVHAIEAHVHVGANFVGNDFV